MLSKITWEQYLMAMGCVLVIYYAGLIILYYRKDIRQLTSRNRSSGSNPGDSAGPS